MRLSVRLVGTCSPFSWSAGIIYLVGRTGRKLDSYDNSRQRVRIAEKRKSLTALQVSEQFYCLQESFSYA